MASPDVLVRPARPDDLAQLLVLLRENGGAPAPGRTASAPAAGSRAQELLTAILEQPGRTLLVAEADGELAGTADLLVVENLMHGGAPWAIVENVFVTSRLRRRGIGRALFAETFRLAREAGAYKLQLLSNKQRVESHGFYLALGFTAERRGLPALLLSTGERTRTSKTLGPPGPKPGASTNSATPACAQDRAHAGVSRSSYAAAGAGSRPSAGT